MSCGVLSVTPEWVQRQHRDHGFGEGRGKYSGRWGKVSQSECTVGENSAWLEGLGYRVFIVPGSTFIKRMVKKYRPKAIIGVGCLMEVKDGIDMSDRIGITAIGVVNFKDGCVETVADWAGVRDAALLGIEHPSGAVDFHGPAE